MLLMLFERLDEFEDDINVDFDLLLEFLFHIFPDRFEIWKFENKWRNTFKGLCILVFAILANIGKVYNGG